jgi:hypothetical protein
MGAFLLTYLGTLIDEFSTFGEWEEGLLSDRLDSATGAVLYSVQPYSSAQHYPLRRHANSYSAKYGPRCRDQSYPKGYHPVVLVS